MRGTTAELFPTRDVARSRYFAIAQDTQPPAPWRHIVGDARALAHVETQTRDSRLTYIRSIPTPGEPGHTGRTHWTHPHTG